MGEVTVKIEMRAGELMPLTNPVAEDGVGGGEEKKGDGDGDEDEIVVHGASIAPRRRCA
mgnify:CR=1 FL=1